MCGVESCSQEWSKFVRLFTIYLLKLSDEEEFSDTDTDLLGSDEASEQEAVVQGNAAKKKENLRYNR